MLVGDAEDIMEARREEGEKRNDIGTEKFECPR